ncbi:MAG: hypothetical protein U0169_09930 [Polyangiaceae bacterium]
MTPVERTNVTAEDLSLLSSVHSLLATLNDPSASAHAVAQHVENIPVLRARLEAVHKSRSNTHVFESGALCVADQIALLGNREVERVLLTLLEDLTELAAEQTP